MFCFLSSFTCNVYFGFLFLLNTTLSRITVTVPIWSSVPSEREEFPGGSGESERGGGRTEPVSQWAGAGVTRHHPGPGQSLREVRTRLQSLPAGWSGHGWTIPGVDSQIHFIKTLKTIALTYFITYFWIILAIEWFDVWWYMLLIQVTIKNKSVSFHQHKILRESFDTWLIDEWMSGKLNDVFSSRLFL